MFRLEPRRGQHQAHQGAGAGDDVGPVCIADRAQRGHGIADTQVVGRLVRTLLRLGCGRVRQQAAQPGPGLARRAVVGGGPAFLQPLGQLAQEGAADAAHLEQGEQAVEVGAAVTRDVVTTEVGKFARGLVARHPFGEAAQVLDQQHPQRGRQRPQLAEVERTRLLVAREELAEQALVESAVGVRDEGPGDAVDARQAREWLVEQHGQGPEVAARQALLDFLQLRLDQMKVVEQPLGRRADVVPGALLVGDVAVCFAQRADVAAQTRHEGARRRCSPRGAVGVTEAAAVLGKTLRTEDLGANGRLHGAARRVQDVDQ